MMMENDPMDENLKALLANYAAPVPDDGFAEAVKTEVARHARLRRALIFGSGTLGALIAALQLPALFSLAQGLPETPKLPADLGAPIEPSWLSTIADSLTWGSLSPVIMGAAIIGIIFLWWTGEAALEAL